MENKAYVYRHRRLDDFSVFYVGIGKTKDFKRAYSKNQRSVFWNSIINKVEYQVEILSTNLSWEDACELEILLIKEYGRKDLGLGNLCNMTDGGDGGLGVKPSLETRRKISEANKGEKNYWFGKKLPKETTDKMKNSIKNRIITKERKDRISQSMKGRTLSEDHKNNLSLARKGMKFSNETKIKLSEAKRGKCYNTKRILNTLTQEIYETVNEASSYFNVCPATLIRHLKGRVVNRLPVEYYKTDKDDFKK